MTITIEIPEHLVHQLQLDWADLNRRALEGFVAEAYREGKLTSAQVSELLGFDNRWETLRFLSSRGLYPSSDLEDFDEDRATVRTLTDKGAI